MTIDLEQIDPEQIDLARTDYFNPIPLGRWVIAPRRPISLGSLAILSVKIRTSSMIGRIFAEACSTLAMTRRIE